MKANQSSIQSRPHGWLSRGELGVVVFTLVYMLGSLVVALVRQNQEFVFYLVVMVILIAIVWFVHWRMRLSLGALWCLAIWGLAHMAGGLMPLPEYFPIKGDSYVLYNLWLIPNWLKYDQLVHAFGFGVVTWICWQGLQKAFSEHRVRIKPSLGLMALCVAAGMGFGAMNEVVEFAATLLLPETNVGGYVNTGWDLVANLVGCVLAATLISVMSTQE